MKNKHVLITGATSGIGKSLAIKLASTGAKLSLCGRSDRKMDDLKNELALPESSLYTETFSITSEESIISFVNNAQSKLGDFDVLINNAGANTAKGKVEEIKIEDLDYMYAVNFRAPFVFMREVYKLMRPQKKGEIVNILSSACLFSNETMASYTGTKAGIEAMTKIFRKEARKEGVNVFAVYPGGVDTNFRAIERPDYLSANSVAETIIANLLLPEDVMMHELVFRPSVEDNF